MMQLLPPPSRCGTESKSQEVNIEMKNRQHVLGRTGPAAVGHSAILEFDAAQP